MAGTGWNKGHKFTRWLRINSADRVRGTDAEFSINMGSSLQKISAMSIVKAQFSNVFYNVFQTSIKYNNYFTLYRSATGLFYNIRIPPGYYSVYTLEAAIISAVSAATGGAVVLVFTLNPDTNIVTVTVPTLAAGYIRFFSTPIAGATNLSTVPLPSSIRQDFNPMGLLGFPTISSTNTLIVSSDGTTTDLTSANSLIATYFPSLNNPSIAYLTSRVVAPGNSFDEKGSKSNVIVPIALTAPFLGLVTFDCQQDVLCEIAYGLPRSLTEIDIQLVDHDLDPLDLHGTELNLDFRLWTNDIN